MSSPDLIPAGELFPERKRESSAAPVDRKVRILHAADAPEVARLEAACFPDAWSESSVEEELNSRLSLYLGIWVKEEMVGYLGSRLVLDEGEILRVAVLPSCRRQGLGAVLMQELMEQTADIVMWNLEVREHNLAAQNLYRRFGFTSIGVRRNYYHDPTEDGIMMQWNRI